MGLLGNSDPYGGMSSLLGIDPKEMRRRALFNGLAAAGFQLMGDKNMGNAGLAFVAGTDRARDDYYRTALDAYKLKIDAEDRDYRRQQDEETKRRNAEIDRQNAWRFGQEQDAAELAESQRLGQQSAVKGFAQDFTSQGGDLFSPGMQSWLRGQGVSGVDPADTQRYNKMQPYMQAQDYGGAFQQMTAEPAKPDLPNSYEEYLLTQQDPRYGEFQTQQKQAGAPSTTINNLPAGQEPPDADLRKKLSEKEADTWTNYEVGADQAGALVQQLQVVDELAKTAPQGPISGRLATMFPGMSSAGDAFNSIVTRIAPSLRNPGSGSQSDREFEAFLTSMPRLANSPGGNEIISFVLQSKANLDIRRGEIVAAYRNNEISAVEARKQLGALRRESILTPEMQQIINQANGGEDDIDALVEEFRTKDGGQ